MVPHQGGAFGQERSPEHSSSLQSGPQVRSSILGTYWKRKPLVLTPGFENWGGDQPLASLLQLKSSTPMTGQVSRASFLLGLKLWPHGLGVRWSSSLGVPPSCLGILTEQVKFLHHFFVVANGMPAIPTHM